MTVSVVETRIELACGQLHMAGLPGNAVEQNLDHLHFLAACLEHQANKKQEQRHLYLLRQARFPMPKTLQQFRFTEIPKLPKMKVEQLAQAEFRLPCYLKGWDRYDLVILDELGYVPLGEGGKLLFQFILQRYERSSLVTTSNLEYSRWGEVLGDPALTTALLDRLTHHAHIPFKAILLSKHRSLIFVAYP